MKIYISKSNKETKNIATQFAKKIKPKDVVLFYGNLGAGKTTFIQGVAQELGIKDRIISPTFILLRTHSTLDNKIKNINHIDLYRLEDFSQIEDLGLEELFSNPEDITMIEWADRLENIPKISGYKVFIKSLGEEKREIKIIKFDE